MIRCLQCGHEFEFDGASYDELGWHTMCPKCNGSFDIDISTMLGVGIMTGILVECTDHKQIYGVLTVEGVSAYEVQEKIYEIKDEFEDNNWEIKDVLERLPKEWKWTYDDNVSKIEI